MAHAFEAARDVTAAAERARRRCRRRPPPPRRRRARARAPPAGRVGARRLLEAGAARLGLPAHVAAARGRPLPAAARALFPPRRRQHDRAVDVGRHVRRGDAALGRRARPPGNKHGGYSQLLLRRPTLTHRIIPKRRRARSPGTAIDRPVVVFFLLLARHRFCVRRPSSCGGTPSSTCAVC